MDESYYTESMRAFVEELGNPHNIGVVITQMEDADGPFLVITFDKNEIESRNFGDYKGLAEYLVGLRNGLIDRGARVTFLVTGVEE